ncbi:globin [Vibrio maritimus]|uniref:globin n=1 Tax=Vibrio maritimus TaxID=990268 RepID=UPI001F17D536|nr:globin [Vibrio maritimus]
MNSNETFLNSYQRCRIGSEFINDFLDLFCDANPRFQERFQEVDKEKQARMIKASLILIQNASTTASIRNTIRNLAIKHKDMGLDISAKELDMWVDSLVAIVAIYDPLYEEVIELAWRDALALGVEIMKDKSVQ